MILKPINTNIKSKKVSKFQNIKENINVPKVEQYSKLSTLFMRSLIINSLKILFDPQIDKFKFEVPSNFKLNGIYFTFKNLITF